mmetsp:Transcript_12063/g.32574  ORF Transcript_12063/g.32574 Transcript_12063/m.32574 type:complete len:168 (+) Transcript_12063:1221-1724(+)
MNQRTLSQDLGFWFVSNLITSGRMDPAGPGQLSFSHGRVPELFEGSRTIGQDDVLSCGLFEGSRTVGQDDVLSCGTGVDAPGTTGQDVLASGKAFDAAATIGQEEGPASGDGSEAAATIGHEEGPASGCVFDAPSSFGLFRSRAEPLSLDGCSNVETPKLLRKFLFA